MRQIDLSAPNPLSCKRGVRKIITRIACRFLRGIFVKSDRLLAHEFNLSGFDSPWLATRDFLGWVLDTPQLAAGLFNCRMLSKR